MGYCQYLQGTFQTNKIQTAMLFVTNHGRIEVFEGVPIYRIISVLDHGVKSVRAQNVACRHSTTDVELWHLPSG